MKDNKIKIFKDFSRGYIAFPKIKQNVVDVIIENDSLFLIFEDKKRKEIKLNKAQLKILNKKSVYYEYTSDLQDIVNVININIKK